MDMKQAMSERHMVRKYTDKPIPTEVAQKIDGRLNDINREYRTDIKLIRGDSTAFNAAIKLVLAKGVRNYFILAGKAAPDLRERMFMHPEYICWFLLLSSLCGVAHALISLIVTRDGTFPFGPSLILGFCGCVFL